MVLGSSGEMGNQVIGKGWKEEREWGVCVSCLGSSPCISHGKYLPSDAPDDKVAQQ